MPRQRPALPYLVFLSYSSEDRQIAEPIAKLLEEKGISVFWDVKIKAGDSIPQAIRQNIQQCDEFLVLLSPNSINRRWVAIEIGVAWGLEKRIVPILDKVTPEQIPENIASYKAIDLNDFDQYLAQLLERAKGALKQHGN